MAQADSIPSTIQRSVLSGAAKPALAVPASATSVIAASNPDAALLALAPRFDEIMAIYEYWAVRDRIVAKHDKMLPSSPDGWLDELSDLLYAVVSEIFQCTARTLPGLALQARALAAIADEYDFDEPYADKQGTFRLMAGIFAVAGELLPELFGRIQADT